MTYFEYGETELSHLRRNDAELGRAIGRIGWLERELTPDIFEALVSSVVSQQISGKAAVTVFGRLQNVLGGSVTPAAIREKTPDEIQRCGMSKRKAGYIKALAESGIDTELLRGLPDAEVVQRLSSLSGVGVWTAEMMLIFSLKRPDVVSYGDLGIRRGMMKLYGLSELTRAEFDMYRARYSPYGTVASLYLWEMTK